MRTLLRALLGYLGMIGFLALLCLAGYIYDKLQRKFNKPRIGFHYFFRKLIVRGDYVCLRDRILRFSHWAQSNELMDSYGPPSESERAAGGELAFYGEGLRYVYYPPSSLKDCKFIYGKYGVKWAASNMLASEAEERVNNYESLLRHSDDVDGE